MNELAISAYAKVNVSLDVLGRLENGYHELLTVMQSVSLHDTITLTKKNEGISLTTNLRFLPTDARNHAFIAAVRFFERTGITGGVHIDIEKRIPVTAGLGGGSSDAAATLVGLNTLFNAGLSFDELRDIGLTVGSDVPFCVEGGTKLARGVGEKLSAMPPFPDCDILIVKPPFSVSTAKVFGSLSASRISLHPDTVGILSSFEQGSVANIARRMYNVLEGVTCMEFPVISEVKHKILSFGALGAVMSGSGPTVFGVFDNTRAVSRAYEEMSRVYKEVYIAKPMNMIK